MTIFFQVLPASAIEAAELDGIVSRLQETYDEVSTLSAAFIEEAYSKSLGTTELSKGKLHLKKPGKVRWKYLGPREDELVSDGRTFWAYHPDLSQVIETPASNIAPNVGINFLMGMGNLREDFSIKLLEEKKDVYLLALTPAEAQQGVKDIRIEVSRKSSLVVKTIVEDPFGNRTTVSLEDIVLNAELKDSLFEFIVPKGVKVITP
ncbi:MAG: outer membrane lipoprotein chaperone LolA [Thermodesulfobacteriota bacterium]